MRKQPTKEMVAKAKSLALTTNMKAGEIVKETGVSDTCVRKVRHKLTGEAKKAILKTLMVNDVVDIYAFASSFKVVPEEALTWVRDINREWGRVGDFDVPEVEEKVESDWEKMLTNKTVAIATPAPPPVTQVPEAVDAPPIIDESEDESMEETTERAPEAVREIVYPEAEVPTKKPSIANFTMSFTDTDMESFMNTLQHVFYSMNKGAFKVSASIELTGADNE